MRVLSWLAALALCPSPIQSIFATAGFIGEKSHIGPAGNHLSIFTASCGNRSLESGEWHHLHTLMNMNVAPIDMDSNTLPRSLRILCFGDSLTAGYSLCGTEHYPYADHLRVGLQHMLSASDIRIDVDGFSGDQVGGLYLKRMKRKCERAAADPYDWIIVMGGTNDLGWGQQPDSIYENLSTAPNDPRCWLSEEMSIAALMPGCFTRY